MFVVKHERELLFELSNLRVTVPDPDYLLAMKMIALRAETEDEKDADFLIRKLQLMSKDEVLSIVADYYPRREVSNRALVWLDEFFQNDYRNRDKTTNERRATLVEDRVIRFCG